jgi:ribosomal protein L40E
VWFAVSLPAEDDGDDGDSDHGYSSGMHRLDDLEGVKASARELVASIKVCRRAGAYRPPPPLAMARKCRTACNWFCALSSGPGGGVAARTPGGGGRG